MTTNRSSRRTRRCSSSALCAAAAVVARRLRERGARYVPSGPRASTRSNAAGLTARELDVLPFSSTGCGTRRSRSGCSSRLARSTTTSRRSSASQRPAARPGRDRSRATRAARRPASPRQAGNPTAKLGNPADDWPSPASYRLANRRGGADGALRHPPARRLGRAGRPTPCGRALDRGRRAHARRCGLDPQLRHGRAVDGTVGTICIYQARAPRRFGFMPTAPTCRSTRS